MRELAELAAHFGLESRGDLTGVTLTGITLSTTDLLPGDVYVGVRGVHAHGASYAADARAGGAVALVTDAAGVELAADSGLPILIVDSPRGSLGALASWVYRTSEFEGQLFGVTGTNGKTSSVYLLEAVLRQLDVVTGLSSTAERHIAGLTVVSRLTTPEATEFHALLARMREGWAPWPSRSARRRSAATA